MQINMLNYSVNKILLLVLSICWLSCHEKAYLPIGTMSKILLKMHLAEGYAQVLPKELNSTVYKNEDSLLKYDAMILKEFKLSKQDFQYNLNYYKQHPELLDSVYLIILSDIAILQAKNNKK